MTKSNGFTFKRMVVAGTVFALGLTGAILLATSKEKPQPKKSDTDKRPLVGVVIAEPKAAALTVKSQGTVEPRRQISLVAQVGGKVAWMSDQFLDGAFFAADQPLLQIEQDDYQFAVIRAEAQVASAKQLVAEETGRNRQAKREWRDLGSEEANDLFLRKPQLESAKASLAAAEADLAAAKLALARSTIKMPFEGRIERKNVDIGQFIPAGTAVAEVYAADSAEVRLPITNAQLALLNLPQVNAASLEPVPVTLHAQFGAESVERRAYISRTEASLNRASRVLFAIADLEDPFASERGDPPMVPGTFVTAEIAGEQIEDLVELPATALRSDDTVLVVADGDVLVRTPVKVWQRDAKKAWVTGLESQAKVVQVQTSALSDGLAVKVLAQAEG